MTANGMTADPVWTISDVIGGVYTFRKRIIRTLRFLLLMAIVGMAYPMAQQHALPWQFWLAAGLFFVSNIAYHFEKADIFQVPRLGIFLFLFDAALLAYMLLAIGERNNEYFAIFALTILMAAMSRSLFATAVSTLAAGAIYALLTLYGRTSLDLLSMAFMTRLAFLFAVSLFVGYLSFETDQTRKSPRLCTDLYRQLFEVSPSYVFLCNRRLQVIQMNPVAEAELGHRLDDVRGHSLAQIADLPDGVGCDGAGAPGLKPMGGIALAFVRGNGTRVRATATVAEVASSAGPLLLVVAHPDAGPVVAPAAQLSRLELRAALGTLGGGLVNEVHGVMLAMAHACERVGPHAQDPAVLAVQEAAERVSRSLRDYKLFAQGAAGEAAAFDLNEVVSRVVRLKAYELRARQIVLDWQPDPALPEAHGDAGAVGQVVLSLLQNAQEAIEEGLAGRTIRVRAGRADRHVWLEIADDGPGIRPEIRPRLFEPFVTHKPEGTGLGLHVARRLLEARGGTIAVQEGVRGGATFRVELPEAAVNRVASSERILRQRAGKAPCALAG
jgi:nitrogen-specific signal transduction histidine kinase